MATQALERAAKARDDQTRLSELVVAWRALRHPRVADLIDRLNANLAKPITAKSVVARTEAIIKAVQSNDPLELGRALASTWPGSWQAAIPVLEAFEKAPDDPRVAKKFAAIVDEAAHQSNGSTAFWLIVFRRLETLVDVRQLPVLEAQLARSKSRFYLWHSREREVRVVNAHRSAKVADLSSDDASIVTALEAPFATLAGTEKTAARSGDELLAAVWARPTDLGLRAVYGDWLVEQGDVRGELIALQLGPRSEKTDKKIRKLIDAHWKRWLGPLADWFRQPPAFEAGFPVSGLIDTQESWSREARGLLLPLLARPEWSTFRHLAMGWVPIKPHELVVLPNFQALTSLARLEPQDIEPLANLGPPLTSLALDWGGDPKHRLARGTWDQLPRLERIFTRRSYISTVLSGFGSHRLATLEIDIGGPDFDQPLDAFWPQLDAAPIDTVLLGGHVRVSRAAPPAPFTRVHFPHDVSPEAFANKLPLATTHVTCEGGYEKLEVCEFPVAATPRQAGR